MYSSKENGVGSAWQTVFPFAGYAASDMSPFLYRPSANYTVVTLYKVQPKFELSIHVRSAAYGGYVQGSPVEIQLPTHWNLIDLSPDYLTA